MDRNADAGQSDFGRVNKRRREEAHPDDTAAAPAGGGEKPEHPAAQRRMDVAVKVECWHMPPNFSLPWLTEARHRTRSSAVVIGERRLLTTAHSVEYPNLIHVKKHGCSTIYRAIVLEVASECDLALLTCNNEEFWDGISPVELGSLPALQDAVTVVGYPTDSNTIAFKRGVVSRMEIMPYAHSSEKLLALQIDAHISSGNSGGPVLDDEGKCVGIVFQFLKNKDMDKIGHVIPASVITTFIHDYDKWGKYKGLPVLVNEWQKMVNPHLRKAMGMTPDQTGILVRSVEPTRRETGFLVPSDIILSIDGTDIANDGTVPLMNGERVGFSYLVSHKHKGDNLSVKVLRKAAVLDLNITLPNSKRLIPHNINGKPPYFIVAGFVFTVLSVPYLQSKYGQDYRYAAPVRLLEKLLCARLRSLDEEVVVVSQVLMCDAVNFSYEDIADTQVVRFNGKLVKNLRELATMVESCFEKFLLFHLADQQIVIVHRMVAMINATAILRQYCIPVLMSADLRSGRAIQTSLWSR